MGAPAKAASTIVVGVLLLPAPSHSESQTARPTVAVMDFDYGTLSTPWWGQYDIGHGVATQLVYTLVEDGRLRVIERSQLAAVLGEQDFAASDRASPDAARLARIGKVLGLRYVIAGSITKFATSDRQFGGGKVGMVASHVIGPVGGLSFHKAKQEVALSARFIDTTTGEVVASAQAEGVANKGQGAALELSNGVGFGTQSPEFRASGIGAAQEVAVTALARDLLAHVGELSAEAPKPDPTPPPPAPAKARPARRPSSTVAKAGTTGAP